MPELLEPDVARRLLVTAARRQQTAAVEHMVRLAYLQQQVDATMLEATLLGELRVKHDACLSLFIQLPAAALKLLLLAAMQQGSKVELFCQLPAAQQLSSAEVFPLLQAAVQYEATNYYHYCLNLVKDLSELPAAQQLDRQAVLQLMQATLQRGLNTRFLCVLPAAQALDRQAVLQLLQAAVQAGAGSSVDALCSIPAAQQLTSEDVLQLLDAAVQQGSAFSIRPLCQLQAAKQLSSGEVSQLLQAAVQYEATPQDPGEFYTGFLSTEMAFLVRKWPII
jgi:hypothetical protein